MNIIQILVQKYAKIFPNPLDRASILCYNATIPAGSTRSVEQGIALRKGAKP
jgi:hypothetical protein